MGTCPEVLYLEKQILHDRTATSVSVLFVRVRVFFFFSFSFHAQLSLLTPAFTFRAGAREREREKKKNQVEFLDETKQNRTTTTKNTCTFCSGRDRTKQKYLSNRGEMTHGHSAVMFKGRLSDAPLDLIIRIFFFFS